MENSMQVSYCPYCGVSLEKYSNLDVKPVNKCCIDCLVEFKVTDILSDSLEKENITNKPEVMTYQQESVVCGIFFRSPIQKVMKNYFPYENEECSSGWWIRAKKQIIPKLLNLDTWMKYPKWEESDSFAGMYVKEICSPIYFKRKQRQAIHRITNHNIESVHVKGWEPYKNSTAGAAEKEVAIITFINGEKCKVVTRERFNYYYGHVVEELVNKK
jgi:hypothetical protein